MQQAKAKFKPKIHGTQYKWQYNANVHPELELVSNQWVFVDKLPLKDKANTVDKMADAIYKGYRRKMLERYESSKCSRT